MAKGVSTTMSEGRRNADLQPYAVWRYTTKDVPRIPPAKAEVPNKPKTELRPAPDVNHELRTLVAFGQHIDCNRNENMFNKKYTSTNISNSSR